MSLRNSVLTGGKGINSWSQKDESKFMESKRWAPKQLIHWFMHLTVWVLATTTIENNNHNTDSTHNLIRETETEITRWRAETHNGESILSFLQEEDLPLYWTWWLGLRGVEWKLRKCFIIGGKTWIGLPYL